MTNSHPTILVIFGATGDLASSKLLPALFKLHQKKLLPPQLAVVGFSRREMQMPAFHEHVRSVLAPLASADGGSVLASFLKLFQYVPGFFDKKEGYETLARALAAQDETWGACSNKLFYLAVPPVYYETMFTHLAASGLTIPCGPEGGWTRVVVEKPFGSDAATAERLDTLLGKLFQEDQIYRIDHYLGKETVQNILAFRFSNDFLDPAWGKEGIEKVEIRVWEKSGVEKRGDFYDAVGALRDTGQNHLLQLLALFAMETPETFDATAVRAGRASALRALRPWTAKEIERATVRAQYRGYHAAPGVKSDSKTETYFRLRTYVDTPRWKDVPFILESGKALRETKAEVVMTFRHKAPCLCPPSGHVSNVLRYEIQPEERVRISLWVKKPGFDLQIEEKDFSFDYHAAYSDMDFTDPHVHPYLKLFLDAINGNQMLFVSTDEIKASWKFIDPVEAAWRNGATPLHAYEPGSGEVTGLSLTGYEINF